jgi:hypothetical protein
MDLVAIHPMTGIFWALASSYANSHTHVWFCIVALQLLMINILSFMVIIVIIIIIIIIVSSSSSPSS